MDHTFWDALTIEVGQEIKVMEVLKKEGSYSTKPLSCVRVSNGGTIGGGVNSPVFRVESLRG
jgi:hypothetical protein